jgi:PilZ domain
MIERSMERRALPREVINMPAMLSFDGISGVHPCVVRDISAFGACLSTPYYMFASDFDLSFSGFHRTFACRVVWRRANLCGVVFVLPRRAPKPVGAKVELASIIQLNRPNALPPMRSASSA